jgi:MSHA biogenesis protein MshP
MSNRLRPTLRGLQRGFNIVTAIFLIVVLALLGVYIVSVSGLQQTGARLDLLGVRGYQAARAGIEWAAFMVLDPNNALNPATCTNLPACPAASTTLPALGGSLSTFTVTVACAALATPATEGNRNIQVYAITSTATTGTVGTTGYINRELQATLSKCLDTTATPPRCACG